MYFLLISSCLSIDDTNQIYEHWCVTVGYYIAREQSTSFYPEDEGLFSEENNQLRD